MIGIVALTPGASVLFPITWVLTAGPRPKLSWMLLLILTFGACLSIGLIILFGDIFNPWFTTFSYLKGAILKVVSIVAAGRTTSANKSAVFESHGSITATKSNFL